MRHRRANRKLGRTSAHRSALFRNQLQAMIDRERIVTTLAKAKELRPIVEKMVTLGKEDSVHNRRLAARSISDKSILTKLFETISPRFADRAGGYTRIIKLGPRRGDGAETAILEFVDFEFEAAEPEPQKKAKSKVKDEPEPDETAEEEAADEEAEEKAPKKSAAKKASKKSSSKKASKKTSSKASGAKSTKKAASKKAGKKSAKKSS